MRKIRRIKNRDAFYFQKSVIVNNILFFGIVFDFARFYLPQRIFVLADIARGINNFVHDFVVFIQTAKSFGRNTAFVSHDDLYVVHGALGHFICQADIVRKNNVTVFFNHNDIADGGYDVVFLVVNDFVGNDGRVISDNINVAGCRDCLHLVVVYHFVSAEINVSRFVVIRLSRR